MTRLALLTPFLPYPPLAGGTAHIFHAIHQLSRFYDIGLYSFAERPARVDWGPLEVWCSELHAFSRVRPPRLSLDPPGVRQDWSPELASFLREWWQHFRPDIVQLEFSSMAQYASLAREVGALAVCTAHNVAFLAQLRRARQERTLKLRARRFAGALSLWQYELRTLRQCDLVVVLGPKDGEVLRRWLPRVPIVHVPSGIDLEQWHPVFNAAAENEVLFVGSYAHPPNVEGAQWLAREVWPRVRRARPQARLTLAGKMPPGEIQRLAAFDIKVPGTLEDLQPLYASASVVVAPIFWGSGVRVKLLEALACSLPIVTTALAAEGLGLHHEQSALFAERPDEFADSIVRLLDDVSLRERIGRNGRAVVERNYDWAQIGRRLAGLYEGARAGRVLS